MSGLNSESFGHEKSFLVSKGASAGLCASPRLERSCDSCRFDEGDENLSPNGLFLRETTPEAEEAISLPLGSWSKPYSPRSNPFGERPSQRTPGARSFIRRLSTNSSLSGGAAADIMAGTARSIIRAKAAICLHIHLLCTFCKPFPVLPYVRSC